MNLLRLIRKINPDVSLEVRTQPHILQEKQPPLHTHVKIKLQASTKLSGQREAVVKNFAIRILNYRAYCPLLSCLNIQVIPDLLYR